MSDIVALLQAGLKHQQSGQIDQAKALYEQVLSREPNQPDALHLLGLIAVMQGRRPQAIELIRRAIASRSDVAAFHVNLGNVLAESHDLAGAAVAYDAALRLDPSLPEVHNNLGNMLVRLRQGREAAASYRRAIELRPQYADAYANLAGALAEVGQLDEAERAARQAIQLQPDSPEHHGRLAAVLRRGRQREQALAAAQRAVELAEKLEPQPALRRDLAIGKAQVVLAEVLQSLDRSADALAVYRTAITLLPDSADARCAAAGLLRNQGRVDEAIKLYRESVAIRPDPSCHGNLLLALHSVSSVGPAKLYEEHVRWARQHATPDAPISPYPNDRSPDRRLRLGFVSGDFREHSVTRFFLRVLEAFDKKQLEIYCYSTLDQPDLITARIKAAADHWRDVADLADADLASLIRSDAIDILVDLAGHTRANRVVMMGRYKPAPVQATWIGWIGTTGVKQIDYCITDALCDPPGEEAHYAEQLYRVSAPYFCYGPPDDSPAVAEAPLLRNGYVTFGSFNNPAKFSPEVMAAWGRILAAVANSRLLIKSVFLGDPQTRESVRTLLAEQGVAVDRVQLIAPEPTTAAHLAAYGSVDVVLDTYPFGGITTTAEALWMGVPVIAWAGRTHVGRVSLSFLDSIGLSELVASGADDYVAHAVALAEDRQQLVRLRADIRHRMLKSLMTDSHAAAREMERAFRWMWRRWCGLKG